MSRLNKYKRFQSFETLERLKRWPGLMKRMPRVRIFSAEHGAFWRGSGQGYTDYPAASNIWSIEEAFKKVCHCCEEKQIRFIPADEGKEGGEG